MKLNKFIASAAALLIASTAAYADKAPFKLQSFERGGKTYLKVTALDDLNLWDVKVNRGNCGVGGNYSKSDKEILNSIKASKNGIYKIDNGSWAFSREYKLENTIIYKRSRFCNRQKPCTEKWSDWDPLVNYHMKYGQTWEIPIGCSEILEVALSTDDTTWTFNAN